MKTYCIMFSTGVVLRTTQEIVYSSKGYSIDKQAVVTEDSCINGTLHQGIDGKALKIHDIVFRSKDIIAEWIEE